jgi:transketolase
MRTAFIKQLVEEARRNDKIFLIAGDLGFNVVEEFASLFPDRFLNAGVAEQNMIGVASGLALEGYNVYVYSIGNFPTLRCMEQIRYDVAYHHLNVKIVAVGGGYAYGSLGTSHHATEELGMIRSIPNMTVCAPGDPVETEAIVRWTTRYGGPVYLRLGKAGEPNIHKEKINNLEVGDIILTKKGDATAILSTGAMLSYVYDCILNNQIEASLYSCPFVKPINKVYLKNIARKYSHIVTIEEHQASTGFGSAILESYNDLYQNNELAFFPRIKRIAIPDRFYSVSGSQSYLRKLANLVLSKE